MCWCCRPAAPPSPAPRPDCWCPRPRSQKAGASLREVCEAVGIPPVLHMGSCVDNSRILLAATNVLHEGGLGEDLSDLPVAGAAPEWMSEKAVAIGHYFVASGLYVVLGHPLYVEGSENVDAPALRGDGRHHRRHASNGSPTR